MKKKRNSKFSSCILCMALMVAIALNTVGCGDKKESGEASVNVASSGQETETETGENTQAGDVETGGAPVDAAGSEATLVGEGSTEFLFTVTDRDGNETVFEVHTDQAIVGEALEEVELIAGEESEYGLFVKTVNGITADYDTDGVYWAFYINGEYAPTGVDVTEITPGDAYAFKVE